jgi:hypothetical protein
MYPKALAFGIIAISALMLAVSGSVAEQSFAKSVSECTNNGGHSSEGGCSGNTNKNNKCEETHAGNSFNSKVKSSEGSGC